MAGVTLIDSFITWVNGEFDFRVVAHELGHTFGLYHADFWHSNTQDPVSTQGVASTTPIHSTP